MPPRKINIQITIYGRVQGVGYRYSALHIARGLDLSGFVKNQYDGTVFIEAEVSSRTNFCQGRTNLKNNRYFKKLYGFLRQVLNSPNLIFISHFGNTSETKMPSYASGDRLLHWHNIYT